MTFELTQDQLSGMGDALTTGWTWLLHIGIQLMPYAIAFVVIMFVFYFIGRLIHRLDVNSADREWSKAEKKYNKWEFYWVK